MTKAEQTTRRRLTRLDSTVVPTYNPTAEEEDDPLFDANGQPRVLDVDDPRAVEFREQLRTWLVVGFTTKLTLQVQPCPMGVPPSR